MRRNMVRYICIFIWTGILLLASYILVKGTTLLHVDIKESWNKERVAFIRKSVTEVLAESYSYLDYGSTYLKNEANGTASYLLANTWNVGGYVLNRTMAGKKEPDTSAIVEKTTILENYPWQDTAMQEKILIGDSYMEQTKENGTEEESAEVFAANQNKIQQLYATYDSEYLIKNFYIVDSTTSVDLSDIHVKTMLEKDFSIQKENKPQILIFHTHGATESFIDSREGVKEDSIIGVGSYLAEILTSQYGYQVIHDETEYDRVDGQIDRNKAYNAALPAISKILEENPSIEVVIDLHRDGVGNKVERTTVINGKETAQIMFFNGLSRNKNGIIDYLENPNQQANLSFSLQLRLQAMKKYPSYVKTNYLKGYRYNMHLKEKYLLIELGNENNTVEQARNAMEPFAEILNDVLMGKSEN